MERCSIIGGAREPTEPLLTNAILTYLALHCPLVEDVSWTHCENLDGAVISDSALLIFMQVSISIPSHLDSFSSHLDSTRLVPSPFLAFSCLFVVFLPLFMSSISFLLSISLYTSIISISHHRYSFPRFMQRCGSLRQFRLCFTAGLSELGFAILSQVRSLLLHPVMTLSPYILSTILSSHPLNYSLITSSQLFYRHILLTILSSHPLNHPLNPPHSLNHPIF